MGLITFTPQQKHEIMHGPDMFYAAPTYNSLAQKCSQFIGIKHGHHP
jgi:hypothetical protein